MLDALRERLEGTVVSRRWPAIRAFLLVLHIVAVIVLSLPGGTKISDPARWKSQRAQHEFALWADRLSDWGFETSPAQFESRLWAFTGRYLAVRDTLTRPLVPYATYAGVSQNWGMFASPTRRPYRLTIEVEEGGRWRPVYVGRSREHDYLSRSLDSNRFRKQVGRTGRNPVLFARLSDWLAKRVFADFPEVGRVRVRLEQLQSLPPARRRVEEPPATTVRELVLERSVLESS